MDLICDRIIQQLKDDRQRDSVHVDLILKTPYRPEKFAVEEPEKIECHHYLEFKPTYPCDGEEGFILSVSGVQFRPNREVVKAFVTSWLDELADESGDDDRMSCVLELSASAGEQRIYKNRVKFDYCRYSGKNKKAVNRLIETFMHIKGLCENMIDS